MAQFINLSIQECNSILGRYEDERQREEQKIREKWVKSIYYSSENYSPLLICLSQNPDMQSYVDELYSAWNLWKFVCEFIIYSPPMATFAHYLVSFIK